MLKAWTGEPFEYRGKTVRSPPSVHAAAPLLMLGGSSKVAVRRAAGFGLPYLPPANLPELEAYYYEQCAEYGTQGFCAMPPEHTAMTHVAEDPERVWRELGHHFLARGRDVRGVAAGRPDLRRCTRTRRRSTNCAPRGSTRWSRRRSSSTGSRRGTASSTCALHPLVGGMPSRMAGGRSASTWTKCSRARLSRAARSGPAGSVGHRLGARGRGCRHAAVLVRSMDSLPKGSSPISGMAARRTVESFGASSPAGHEVAAAGVVVAAADALRRDGSGDAPAPRRR